MRSIQVMPVNSPIMAYGRWYHRGTIVPLSGPIAARLVQTLEEHGCKPAWIPDQSPPETVVRLPWAYARLLARGDWNSLIVPSVSRYDQIPWNLLGIARPGPAPELPSCKVLDSARARQAADFLRDYAASNGLEEDMFQAVAACCSALDQYATDLSPQAILQALTTWKGHNIDLVHRSRRKQYKAGTMLRCMICADLLRADDSITESCIRSIKMMLPPSVAEPALEMITSASERAKLIPGKSTISKYRVLVDTALMIFERLRNDLHPQIRYMMADSSTQHGRDFEHVVWLGIRKDCIVETFRAANCLINLWESSSTDDEDAWAAEKPLLRVLDKGLQESRLPVLVLGSGRTGLMHKFQTLLHGCFLVAGTRLSSVKTLMESIVSCTSDLGTEYSLPTVAPRRFGEWLPWASAGRVPGPVQQAPEESDMSQACDMIDPEVSLEAAIPVAGLLHILHNAGNSLLRACPTLESTIDDMKEVCAMVKHEHTCLRLRDALNVQTRIVLLIGCLVWSCSTRESNRL